MSELKHYGIKGRSGRHPGHGNPKQKQKQKPRKRKVSDLSDEELQRLVKRMSMERQYKAMLAANSKKSKIGSIMDTVANTSNKVNNLTSSGLRLYENYKKIEAILNKSKGTKKKKAGK